MEQKREERVQKKSWKHKKLGRLIKEWERETGERKQVVITGWKKEGRNGQENKKRQMIGKKGTKKKRQWEKRGREKKRELVREGRC